METKQSPAGPIVFVITTVLYVILFSVHVVKRSAYATRLLAPRLVSFIFGELALLPAIYRGADIVFVKTEAQTTNNYHLRYEQSARGNVSEAAWKFGDTSVKVNA